MECWWHIFWINKEGDIEKTDGPYLSQDLAEVKAAVEEFDKPDLYPHIRPSFSKDPMVALREYIQEGVGGTTADFLK